MIGDFTQLGNQVVQLWAWRRVIIAMCSHSTTACSQDAFPHFWSVFPPSWPSSPSLVKLLSSLNIYPILYLLNWASFFQFFFQCSSLFPRLSVKRTKRQKTENILKTQNNTETITQCCGVLKSLVRDTIKQLQTSLCVGIVIWKHLSISKLAPGALNIKWNIKVLVCNWFS